MISKMTHLTVSRPRRATASFRRISCAVNGLRTAASRTDSWSQNRAKLWNRYSNGSSPARPQRSDQLKPRSLVPQNRLSSGMSLRRGRPVVRTRRHCLSQVFVRVSGKPADPTDLPFVETHPEPGAPRAAVDDLIARKRHLARKRPSGKSAKGRRPPPLPWIWPHVRGNEPNKHGCLRAPGQALFECAARHSRNWSSRVLGERACLGRRL